MRGAFMTSPPGEVDSLSGSHTARLGIGSPTIVTSRIYRVYRKERAAIKWQLSKLRNDSHSDVLLTVNVPRSADQRPMPNVWRSCKTQDTFAGIMQLAIHIHHSNGRATGHWPLGAAPPLCGIVPDTADSFQPATTPKAPAPKLRKALMQTALHCQHTAA